MSLPEVVKCMFMFLVFISISDLGYSWYKSKRTIIGYATDSYSFPWLCSVTLGDHYVSTCTIIQASYVICSVDNLIQNIPDSRDYFYEFITDMTIHAGSEQKVQKNPNPTYYQRRSIFMFYVANVSDFRIPTNYDYVVNPKNFSAIVFDAYGVALNIGLLRVTQPFTWSAHVQPAPFPGGTVDDMEKKIKSFSDNLYAKPLDQTPCMTASWQKSINSMVFTEVVIVPKQACMEAYCVHDPMNCLTFPKLPYLMCFKSLVFADLCPSDRGAAVFCPTFSNQVVGILTTATNCGAGNLPSVYTSVDSVARFYKKVTRRELEPGPSRDKYTTTQP